MQFLIDIGLSILYFCIFLLLCAWAWRFWVMYVNQKFLNKIDWLLLEVKLPREINKSPLATEVALASFIINSGISTKYDRLFKGALPVYSSLEIASIEGVIHFYIRIQRRFRPLIESNFYAQYPGIELVEADDYTKRIRFHHLSKDVNMWGVSFKTTGSWTPTNEKTGKPFSKKGKDTDIPKEGEETYSMKADFLPIKTYVDFGLDKDPKEEFKVDPLAQLIETLGSVSKGEHMWYQVLIQDESVYDGKKRLEKFYINEKTHKHLSLKDMADQRKKQLRTASWNIKGKVAVSEFGVPTMIESFTEKDGVYTQEFEKKDGKDGEVIKIPIKVQARHLETKQVSKKETELTTEEKDEIEAINTKLSKPLFLCVVRLLYVTKKENFNPQQIPNTLAFPRTFKGANVLNIANTSDPYDYPWQKSGIIHPYWRAEEMFEEYVEREGFFPHIKARKSLDEWEDRVFWSSSMKQRKLFRMLFESIFYPFDHPHADGAFTLNLEEVATLWHLPGATVATPTLPRIDSNKGVAPPNLPL